MIKIRTYTTVYYDNEGDVHTYTCPGIHDEAAATVASKDLGDAISEIITIIPHHIPKVTVVLDGDMVQAAYSDSEVEILHCYADKEAVGNGLSLMPGSRHSINYPNKADHAHPFGWVGVDHNPEAVSFDHKFAKDDDMIEEFTNAVREEFEA